MKIVQVCILLCHLFFVKCYQIEFGTFKRSIRISFRYRSDQITDLTACQSLHCISANQKVSRPNKIASMLVDLWPAATALTRIQSTSSKCSVLWRRDCRWSGDLLRQIVDSAGLSTQAPAVCLSVCHSNIWLLLSSADCRLHGSPVSSCQQICLLFWEVTVQFINL